MPADKVERVKNVAMGGQELATVVGDLVVDVANAIRTAEKQSLLEAAQGAMLPHALRLKQMTGKIGADAVQWIKQGGLWRGILFTAVSFL
jgi:methionine salvage enolase-phosphatase E1